VSVSVANALAQRPIANGALLLRGAVHHPAVTPWCPRDHPTHGQPLAVITVHEDHTPAPAHPVQPHTLRWNAAHLWIDPASGALQLRAPTVWGEGALDTGMTMRLAPHAPLSQQADDMAGALLLCAGVLLGAAGALLVHAGAVVDHAGRAWLLAGDTHSGKSTTVATLSAAGVPWVCDDTLLVTPSPTGPMVHGWVRRPHLDRGYVAGTVVGERITAALADHGPFALPAWRPSAPLGGVLLPTVRAHLPTALEPVPAREAFAVLVRQGPWAGALPPARAAALLGLLGAMANGPAHRLWLGRDGYGNAEVLGGVLRAAWEGQ
jgi:hypothetical protein